MLPCFRLLVATSVTSRRRLPVASRHSCERGRSAGSDSLRNLHTNNLEFPQHLSTKPPSDHHFLRTIFRSFSPFAVLSLTTAFILNLQQWLLPTAPRRNTMDLAHLPHLRRSTNSSHVVSVNWSTCRRLSSSVISPAARAAFSKVS